MSQKEKRQFVTIPITRGSSRTGEPEVTLAVDEIKSISDLRATVPIFEEGARADVLLKGKEGQGYHATISREEILARIEAPREKPALLRFRRRPGNEEFPIVSFDVVAINAAYAEPLKQIRVVYVIRTDAGKIQGITDGEFEALQCRFEEI